MLSKRSAIDQSTFLYHLDERFVPFSISRGYKEIATSDGNYDTDEIAVNPEIWGRLNEEARLSYTLGMNFDNTVMKMVCRGLGCTIETIGDQDSTIVERKIRDCREDVMKAKSLSLLAFQCELKSYNPQEDTNDFVMIEVINPEGEIEELSFSVKNKVLFDHTVLDLRITEKMMETEELQAWDDESRMALVAGVVLHDSVKNSNFYNHHLDSAVFASEWIKKMYWGNYEGDPRANSQALPYSEDRDAQFRFLTRVNEEISEHSGYSLYMNSREIENYIADQMEGIVDSLDFSGFPELSSLNPDRLDDRLTYDGVITQLFWPYQEKIQAECQRQFEESGSFEAIEKNDFIRSQEEQFLAQIKQFIDGKKEYLRIMAENQGMPDDYQEDLESYLLSRAEYLTQTPRPILVGENIQYKYIQEDLLYDEYKLIQSHIRQSGNVDRVVKQYLEDASSSGLQVARENLPRTENGVYGIKEYLDSQLPIPSTKEAKCLAEADNVQLATPPGQKKIMEIAIGGAGVGEDNAGSIAEGIESALQSAFNNLSLFEDGSIAAEIAEDGITAWILAVNTHLKSDSKLSNEEVFNLLNQARGNNREFLQVCHTWVEENLQSQANASIKLKSSIHGNSFPEELPDNIFEGLMTEKEEGKFVPRYWLTQAKAILEKASGFEEVQDIKEVVALVRQLRPVIRQLFEADVMSEGRGIHGFIGDYQEFFNEIMSEGEFPYETYYGAKFGYAKEAVSFLKGYLDRANTIITSSMADKLVQTAAIESAKFGLDLTSGKYDFLWTIGIAENLALCRKYGEPYTGDAPDGFKNDLLKIFEDVPEGLSDVEKRRLLGERLHKLQTE